MLLYVDDYQTIKLNNQNSLLELGWTDATSELIEKNYQKRIEKIVYHIENQKPSALLADTQDLIYTTTFTHQPKFVKNLYSKLVDSHVKKLAFIKSKDVITQHILEEIIKEGANKQFTTRYFDDEESAKQWLNEE